MFRFLTAFLLIASLTGCGVESERVYSLRLAKEPSSSDWDRAVGYKLRADGGVTSQPGDSAVDEDSVHTATASCHHGAGSPPVNVEIKSFYTDEKIFLRFEWMDPTRDEGPLWRWGAGGWTAAGAREDGLGVLWAQNPEGFECAHLCHLVDWRMAGAKKSSADYAMAAQKGEAADFWIWRAGKARVGGMAEDANLTDEGKVSDDNSKKELFQPNSARASKKIEGAFQSGDQPLSAPKPEPGAVAMGYLLDESDPARMEVAALGSYEEGRWSLTVSRTLKGGAGDLSFEAGKSYKFGLAILDGVALDHNAARKPITVTLVDKASTESK